jgi:hypothetical protein
VEHVDGGVVDGDVFGVAHAGGVLGGPFDAAFEVAGEEVAAAFRAVAGEDHAGAVGGGVGGDAVVAEPGVGGLAGPWSGSAVAGVPAEGEARAGMGDGLPGVAAGGDGMAGGAEDGVVESVPLRRLRAFPATFPVEEVAGDDAPLPVEEVERDIAVEGHVEGDLLEPGPLEAADQAGPVDDGRAVLHRDGERAAVGGQHRLRGDFGVRGNERGPVPQCWKARKVKIRSGVATRSLKMSLMVMRPKLPAVKFGSTVNRMVSPAAGARPATLRSFQGMEISWE